ncbi:MAG: hypothetical protein ACI88A_001126 [Paraglaciecola sp.]|jgi:hypothetical protein
MIRTTILIVLLTNLLASCASMDKSECLAADWYTVGFEDGSSGLPESNIANYRKDCAQHAVTPKFERYRAGHYQGSKNFCNAANGFAQGQQGHEYKGSCPDDLREDFLAAYTDGQHLYSLRNQLESEKKILARSLRGLNEISLLINDKSELMIQDGLIREQRAELQNEIKILQEEKLVIEGELGYLQDNIGLAQQKYDDAEQFYRKKGR